MADFKIEDVETIIRKYADMVYRIASVHTPQEKDAEDVFQEVFLRLVKHIDTVQSEEHLKAWLIRVTINCCKTQMGSAWKRRMVIAEGEDLERYASAEEMMGEEADGQEIQEAVRSLPPQYRDVIHLHYFEELSIKEISSVLRRREGTIKSQLSRARVQLSKVLKNPWDRRHDYNV